MKRKMISAIVVMTMLLIGCSKDDSEPINQDDTTDIVTTEKSIYKLVFTQRGEVENFTGALFFSGLSDDVYDVNTLEVVDGKEVFLGRTAIVNMHERKEGSYTFLTEEKTKSVHIVVTTSGYSITDVGVTYNMTVYKDDEEIFNQDFEVVKGSSSTPKSYVF